MRTGRELRIGERTDARAHEPAHRMTDLRAHAADDALAPFLQHDLERAAAVVRRCTTCARTARAGPSSSSTPSRSARNAPGARHAFDLGEVRLLDAVARMRQQLGELAVVGEHQQAFGVEVEPADRERPRLGRHELDHRRPALRIVRGRDVARGLVQQPVHARLVDDDRHAVDDDAMRARGRRARRAPRPRRRRSPGPPRSAPRTRAASRGRRARAASAAARLSLTALLPRLVSVDAPGSGTATTRSSRPGCRARRRRRAGPARAPRPDSTRERSRRAAADRRASRRRAARGTRASWRTASGCRACVSCPLSSM